MKTLIGFLLGLASAAALGAPTVSMTAPANGNLYLAPGTFAVKANASAPGVGVNRVEFYANGALIHTDTTSPYQFDWTNVAAGSYAITAKAVDNAGAETTSAPRNVTVAATNTAPTVSLSAPADNARYLNPSSVTLSANASGPELNDILQKVEFFVNGTLAGTVTSAPYSFNWTSPALGTYTLTAVATDSQGAQTTSGPRTVDRLRPEPGAHRLDRHAARQLQLARARELHVPGERILGRGKRHRAGRVLHKRRAPGPGHHLALQHQPLEPRCWHLHPDGAGGRRPERADRLRRRAPSPSPTRTSRPR